MPAPRRYVRPSVADLLVLADACEARSKTEGHFDTFVGNGPDKPTRNYVVLYFSSSKFQSRLQSGSQADDRFTMRAVCVGLNSARNSLYVVRWFRPLFLNWSPVPDLNTSWFEEQDDDAPVIKEPSSVPGDTRFSTTLRYTLNTRS